MPHRPKKVKKSATKSSGPNQADQRAEQRRADFAARSTLSRIQNRKSEKK
jgi:hypothetical protein